MLPLDLFGQPQEIDFLKMRVSTLFSLSSRPPSSNLQLFASLLLLYLVSSSYASSYIDWYLAPETGLASTNCSSPSSPCPAFPTDALAEHLCYAGVCRFHLLPGEYYSPSTGLLVAGNVVQVILYQGVVFHDTALAITSSSTYNQSVSSKPLTIANSSLVLSGNASITISSTNDLLLDHVYIAVNSSVSSPISLYTSGGNNNVKLESTKIESIATDSTPSRAFTLSGPSYGNFTMNNCSFTGFTHTIVSLIPSNTINNFEFANSKVSNLGGVFFVSLTGSLLNARFITLENNTFTGMSTLAVGSDNFAAVAELTVVAQNSFTGWWAFDVSNLLHLISNNFTDSDTIITTKGAEFALVELNTFHEASLYVSRTGFLQFDRNTLYYATIDLYTSALAASHVKSFSSIFYLNTSQVTNYDYHYCSIQYSTFYTDQDQVVLDAQYFYIWKVDFTPVDAPSTDYTLSLLSTQHAPSMIGDFTAYGLTIDIQGPRTLLFEGKLYLEKSLFGSTTYDGQVHPLRFDTAGSIILGQSSFDGKPVKVDNIDFTSFVNASFVASLYNPNLPVATFSGPSNFTLSNHTLYFFLNGPKVLGNSIAPGSFLSVFNGSIDLVPFKQVIQPAKTLGYAGSVNLNLTSTHGPSVQYIVSSTSCYNNCSNRGQCVGANKCVCDRPYSGYDCSCDTLVGNAICNSNSYASGWNLAGSLDTSLNFPKSVDIIFGGDVLVQNSASTEFNNALYDVRGNIAISGTLSVSSKIEQTANASDAQNRCFFRATSRASSSGLSFGSDGVLHVKLDLTGAEKTNCPSLTNSTLDSVPPSLDTTRALLGGLKRTSSSGNAAIAHKIRTSIDSILGLVRQDPFRGGNFNNIEMRASKSFSRDDYSSEFDTTLAEKSVSLFQFNSFQAGGSNGAGKIKIDLSGSAPSGPIEIRIFDARLTENEGSGIITTGVVTGLDLIQVEVKDTSETCHELRGGPGIISLFLTPCDNKGFSSEGKLAWYAYGIPIIIVGILLIAAVIVILTSSRVRGFFRPYSAASANRAESLANQTGAK